MKINVHGGHNKLTPGAHNLLDELTEDRKVKAKVINLLRAAGHTVYDCTDDKGKTEDDNLVNIVKKCNAHEVNVDASIHLNCGRNDKKGDGNTGGVEVIIYDKSASSPVAAAERVAANISKALGIRNRGVKVNPNLYALRYTNAPAMLIECCFVDDKDDVKRWDADKCAKAIAEGIMGKKIEEKKTSNVIAVVEYMTEKGVKCYLNVYSKDKLTKCSGHGRYNQTLTIGTDGARNCFLSYKNGEACGKSHCKKPKGTLLHVRNVKDLK
ncbi:N-acetylmuramoyl-L-alanine amidase [Eubacterium sp. AM28-8LB]|uniref:N-acetylmuramoyl-L-alanine amidase n=1 Tax=Longicatena caecimuris TaxID=1796635 RepID=UPI000E72BC20|nr:N-acetylmuramoyl-L-alanine amidase [Longicatena caecimuris]RJW07639.1 N-acetylmuramoyl-L-alanine amidase [Eubacterium sp. AM28-8LB]